MGDDVDLYDLRVLSLLIEVGSLTQVARILGIGQPAVSKALARLRRQFADPLLVRVGGAMRPTSRAAAMLQPLDTLLAAADVLRVSNQQFDPTTSTREFTVLLTEVGMILQAPRLMRRLQDAGPNLRLKALALDTRALEARLGVGEADLAIGAYPEASGGLRRQHLYVDGYLAVVRRSHPRLGGLDRPEAFADKSHIAVSAVSVGHSPHGELEQAMSVSPAADRARMRVPSFLAAAFVASRTDMVAVLPKNLAVAFADDLQLATFVPPLTITPIRVDQLWHERVQHDDGHRWLRGEVHGLFGQAGSWGAT